MIKNNAFLLFFVSLTLFAACNKDEENDYQQNKETEHKEVSIIGKTYICEIENEKLGPSNIIVDSVELTQFRDYFSKHLNLKKHIINESVMLFDTILTVKDYSREDFILSFSDSTNLNYQQKAFVKDADYKVQAIKTKCEFKHERVMYTITAAGYSESIDLYSTGIKLGNTWYMLTEPYTYVYTYLKVSQSVVLYILAKNPQKSSSFGHKYGKI